MRLDPGDVVYISGPMTGFGCYNTKEEAFDAYVVEKRKKHEGCTL